VYLNAASSRVEALESTKSRVKIATAKATPIVLMQLLTAATTSPVSDSNFLSNLRFVFINQTYSRASKKKKCKKENS